MQRFIVAEVSQNWVGPYQGGPMNLLSERFEKVIATNLARGYLLHSFQLHQVMIGPDTLNETIIAVFERHPKDSA